MRKIKYYNTLRFKLGISAVFLVVIPIIALAVSFSQTVKEVIKDKYSETALESVFGTGEKIDFILNDIQEFSAVIISNENFLKMMQDASAYNKNNFNSALRNFITVRDDIEVIQLQLAQGNYHIGANKVSSIVRVENVLTESTGEPVWLPTKKVSLEILSGEFDKYYFTLGRKIVDYNTLDDYGYLLIDLEEDILQQAYASLIDGSQGEVFIVNNSGRIISHPDKTRIGQTIIFEPYANQVLGDKTGHSFVQYTAGVDKVAIYSTLKNHDWKIIKTVPTAYLYQEINQIQKYFVIGGTVYGVMIIVFMMFFAFRYTEPMLHLMGVIKRVEQGDLAVRADIHTNDEIGQLGTSLNQMIYEMQELISRLIREEQSKKELELEALHAQINPHFLYNTLNTIKWMAKIQGNKSVSSAVTALIKLLRISTNLGKDKITLREEIDYVQNYVVIQKLRFNEAIHIHFDIDENCLDLMIPKLILQPIVENSIIYGVAEEGAEVTIQIRAFREDAVLRIVITDDGPGISHEIVSHIFRSPADENKFSTVGLNNVNQRIKLYCGEEYGLVIETAPGSGTTVSASLGIQ